MSLREELLDTKYRETSIVNPDDDPEIISQMRDAYNSFPVDKIEFIPSGKSGVTGPVNFAMRIPPHKRKKEK